MKEINRILELDSSFLREHNLIDYSVLIKVEKINLSALGMPKQRNVFIAEDGHEAYHIGVIDYL